MNFIPYGRQWIEEDDVQAVIDTLKSEYLTTGPAVKSFEENLANIVGARYSVAVSNGTAALHAACFAAGVGEGDEVITSPVTFAASANCALYMGARPIFADIDSRTYNIDPSEVRRKITKRTKAIIPVHFTGQPCNMDEIMKLAQEFGLVVIEDGAHALGAAYQGKKIGSIGDMTTFSFHPVKHITTGEGGAVTTDSQELYKKLLIFRTHGITRDRTVLEANEGDWYYEQQFLGFNYRLTDIQAALGSSQLKKLERFVRLRKEYVKRYNDAFFGLEGIVTPYLPKWADSSWHLYIIQIEPELLTIDRQGFFNELKNKNIGVNVHYIPVYYHPYYRKLGYKKGLCPNAEQFYDRILTLPLFPGMKEEEIDYVIKSVKEIIDKYKR